MSAPVYSRIQATVSPEMFPLRPLAQQEVWVRILTSIISVMTEKKRIAICVCDEVVVWIEGIDIPWGYDAVLCKRCRWNLLALDFVQREGDDGLSVALGEETHRPNEA